MTRIKALGIGGVFFKSPDKESLLKWYTDKLGLPVESWGGCVFNWEKHKTLDTKTVFSVFKNDTNYMSPSSASFMINFVVDDLEAMLVQLKADGVESLGMEKSEFGSFAWILDPDNNKIELWQPPAR